MRAAHVRLILPSCWRLRAAEVGETLVKSSGAAERPPPGAIGFGGDHIIKFSRRVLTLFTFMAVLLIGVAAGSPAAFAQPLINNNPIDWTIDTPFTGSLGDAIPLRVGQHDDNEDPRFTVDGFGVRHIQDAHGAVPPPEVIDDVLQHGSCNSVIPGRFTCKTDEATVIFNTDVDPRSGDDIPFGIISAFFNAPDPGCGC